MAAQAEGDRVRLSVEDDGPGPGQSTHAGARTALADLRKRVELLYGDAAAIEEDRGPLGGYRLQLWLPRKVEESQG